MGKRARPAAKTPAILVLDRAGVEHSVLAYAHDPTAASYGLEAVEALGLPPAQVYKTLLVRAGNELVVAVVPVAGHLDLKALATTVGTRRAALAEPAEAERATGYVVGGISPLGQRKRLRTVLDESALAHATVYVSGGRRGLEVGLSPHDLARLLDAVTAPIGR